MNMKSPQKKPSPKDEGILLSHFPPVVPLFMPGITAAPEAYTGA